MRENMPLDASLHYLDSSLGTESDQLGFIQQILVANQYLLQKNQTGQISGSSEVALRDCLECCDRSRLLVYAARNYLSLYELINDADASKARRLLTHFLILTLNRLNKDQETLQSVLDKYDLASHNLRSSATVLRDRIARSRDLISSILLEIRE
jgi:hypothetical protein